MWWPWVTENQTVIIILDLTYLVITIQTMCRLQICNEVYRVNGLISFITAGNAVQDQLPIPIV